MAEQIATCGHALQNGESLETASLKTTNAHGGPAVARVMLCAACRQVYARMGVVLRNEGAERAWLSLPRAVGVTY